MTLTPDDLAEATKLIKRQEGFSPIAYRDTEGKLTVAFGRLIEPPGGITIPEGEMMLANDIVRADASLSGFDWYRRLAGPRKVALLAMRFQLGTDGVRGFIKMISAIVREDWNAAADEMLASAWHTQTPKRCEEVAAQLRTGSYP